MSSITDFSRRMWKTDLDLSAFVGFKRHMLIIRLRVCWARLVFVVAVLCVRYEMLVSSGIRTPRTFYFLNRLFLLVKGKNELWY